MELSRAPTVDVSLLTKDSDTKALVIKEIGKACQDFGFFNVINHEISEFLIQEATDANLRFFDLPIEEKKEYMSKDIYKPIRFGTVQDDRGSGMFARDFLKLYAYPYHWIGSWPQNPSDYREKMEAYTNEMRRLSLELLEAITESLNLKSANLQDKIVQGMQFMAVNCYQPALQSNIPTGIPQHTDHGLITIVLQSSPGLHVLDHTTGTWEDVPRPVGSLQVLVGDQLEVLSNGMYKSVLHRAIPRSEKVRLSVVSVHSFAMDEVVEPAMGLVDEMHPKCYKGGSFRDFLKHLACKESKPFIETLKIKS